MSKRNTPLLATIAVLLLVIATSWMRQEKPCSQELVKQTAFRQPEVKTEVESRVPSKQEPEPKKQEVAPPNSDLAKSIHTTLSGFFDKSEDGKIILPSGVTDVIIDVGLSNSPILPSNDHEMVIGLEPVYEVSQQNNNLYRSKYGGRFISISVAAGDQDGYVIFHDHTADKGTSSMLETDDKGIEFSTRTRPQNAGSAMKEANRRIVPLVRLESLLLDLPPSVRIKHLKVDAQGADCLVLLGCGEGMKRVETVKAEIAVKGFVYKGACRKEEMLRIMNGYGFKLEHESIDSDELEADLTFGRN